MSSVDDETILEVLRTADEPRLTTTEVAGRLPITRGTTRTRLQALVDEGLVTREREGRNVVWWLPERADEVEAPAGGDLEGAEADEAETDEEPEASDEEVEAEPEVETDEPEPEAESEEPEAEAEAEADTDETGADDESESVEDELEVEVEPTEGADAEREEVELDVDEDDEADEAESIDARTPDRETETRAETLPEAPGSDRTVQAVLALVALGVLYALVRRLRG